jgi:hypothetical protein
VLWNLASYAAVEWLCGIITPKERSKRFADAVQYDLVG